MSGRIVPAGTGRLFAAALLAGVASIASGHGDEPHPAPMDEALLGAVSDDRPRWLSPQALWVPKPVQHLLGIRTEPYNAAAAIASGPGRVGTVVADPGFPALVAASREGVLVPDGGAWPRPGTELAAGSVVGRIRSEPGPAQRAQLEAERARLEQQRFLSNINVERLRLQTAAVGVQASGSGVYLEQAEAEQRALEQALAAIDDALSSETPLRTTAGGIVVRVHQPPGARVAAGDPVIELAGSRRPWISVRVWNDLSTGGPELVASLHEAEAPVPLDLAGFEPLPGGGRGGALLLRPRQDTPALWLPGERVTVHGWPDSVAPPCEDLSGRVWIHVAPERFERRAGEHCHIAAGERRVTQGASMLDQYP